MTKDETQKRYEPWAKPPLTGSLFNRARARARYRSRSLIVVSEKETEKTRTRTRTSTSTIGGEASSYLAYFREGDTLRESEYVRWIVFSFDYA